MAKMAKLWSQLYTIVCLLCVTANADSLTDRHPPAERNRITVKGNWLVDKYGRVRIFHGFNAVEKGFPWYSDKLRDDYLKLYKEWGFTAVRMGMMWAGVKPARGVTNQTYLDITKDMVKRAGDYGIYSLLDMHQDVISSKFQSYDGVPRWVIDKMPDSKHQYPWPLPKSPGGAAWGAGYLTEAVGHAFQSLYDNTAGTQDDMATFWETVASNFKSLDTTIGYELINEPWAGDVYKSPELLLPGIAGQKNLQPLYDSLNKAIRAIDNDTLIFYEPVTWGMIFPGNGALGSGFTNVPGGSAFANQSVMSWHYYCWVLNTDDSSPYPTFKRTICDKLLGPKVFETVRKDVKRIGGASFLTEFGTCEPNNFKNETETIECEFVLNSADDNLQSWTYWDSQFFNTTSGAVRSDIVRHFARVYAKAIAGTPIQMKFDLDSHQFKLVFLSDDMITAPTEIIVPPIQYRKGFVVKVSNGYRWEYDRKNYIVKVFKGKSEEKMSSLVTVNIYPK